MYIPDNYDAFVLYERELERRERLYRCLYEDINNEEEEEDDELSNIES